MQPLEPRLLLAFESDIVADGVTGVAGAYEVGQRITARADFYNGGNIGTGAFKIRFYLATSGDSTVVLIQEREILNLSPCCPSNAIIGVPGWQIPYDNETIRPGRYRVAAHLDWYNDVAETSGSNNVAYSTFFDIRHPDLRTESVTGVDTQYAPGSLLNVTATVVNDGPARAWGSLLAPYVVAFYLGADQSEPPTVSSMTLLNTGWIQGNLDDGDRTTDVLNDRIPFGQKPGRYRIWVKVDSDDQRVEVSENNNWRSSAPFTVLGPDLAPTPVTGVRSFYALDRGQSINADVRVRNVGATDAEGTMLKWYLGPVDTSGTPSAGELELLQQAPIRPILSEGEATDHLPRAVSGLNPGEYRLWAHVDANGVVDEQDESNNWSHSDAFRIVNIVELRWEDAAGGPLIGPVDEGTEVFISFEAEGFDTNGFIPVEIWEDDPADDELEREGLRVRYDPDKSRWRAPWWPAWSKDDSPPLAFYFHLPADWLGFTLGFSSQDLIVNKRDDDFGFQISGHTVGTGVPLVLVHGNRSDTAGRLYRWQWFDDFIRAHTDAFAEFDVYVWKHDTSKPIGFNGASGSQAASLGDYIYNTLKVGVSGKYADKRVALLAHSQGGLVARSFMNRGNQGDDVSGLITLGTPHHGSPFGVTDWLAAAWAGDGGTQAGFDAIQSAQGDRDGTINLAWDNLDGAIVGPHSANFPVKYDLTDHDINDIGAAATDPTRNYPSDLKDSYGTLAALNAGEAYYHKLFAVGAYDRSLADNPTKAEMFVDVLGGTFSPDWSSEHRRLGMVTRLLGQMSESSALNDNGSPYYANDGLVPLQSALFLDVRPPTPEEDEDDAKFSSLGDREIAISESRIESRTPRDMKTYVANDNVQDHQDILDSASASYWQRIVNELRLLIESTPPTATLEAARDGEPVGRSVLNRRGYLDVTYLDAGGSGLDPRSILDAAPEFVLSDPAADGVTITGVERREGDTYRYFFDGQFGMGRVILQLIPGAFGDDAGNVNAAAVHEFSSVTDGDANPDGRIDADDYFRIDQGFLAQPTTPTYAQGDFNDDQRINADDYFLIDRAFLGQGSPLAGDVPVTSITTASDVVLSVPEEPQEKVVRKRAVRPLFSDEPVLPTRTARRASAARRR